MIRSVAATITYAGATNPIRYILVSAMFTDGEKNHFGVAYADATSLNTGYNPNWLLATVDDPAYRDDSAYPCESPRSFPTFISCLDCRMEGYGNKLFAVCLRKQDFLPPNIDLIETNTAGAAFSTTATIAPTLLGSTFLDIRLAHDLYGNVLFCADSLTGLDSTVFECSLYRGCPVENCVPVPLPPPPPKPVSATTPSSPPSASTPTSPTSQAPVPSNTPPLSPSPLPQHTPTRTASTPTVFAPSSPAVLQPNGGGNEGRIPSFNFIRFCWLKCLSLS